MCFCVVARVKNVGNIFIRKKKKIFSKSETLLAAVDVGGWFDTFFLPFHRLEFFFPISLCLFYCLCFDFVPTVAQPLQYGFLFLRKFNTIVIIYAFLPIRSVEKTKNKI